MYPTPTAPIPIELMQDEKMATSSVTRQPKNCPFCETFAAPNLKGVIRHIGLVHSHEANFRITCGIDGCTRTYRIFDSYRKHVYVKHRAALCSVSIGADEEHLQDVAQHFQDDAERISNTSNSYSLFSEEEDQQQVEPYFAQRDRNSALFILKAREIHKISQSSLNSLLGDISTYVDMTKVRLIQLVNEALRAKGIEMGEELQALSDSPTVSGPFKNLRSEHLQTQYFIKKFQMVEPTEIKLGWNMTTIIRKSKRRHKKVWDYAYYVPLLSSLQQILSDEFILSNVLTGHSRQDGIISDYCDGSAYRSHPLYSHTYKSLELILYYDDVEVCNPLGSRAKVHKIGIFYYTLGNLPPKYRSSLHSIQLLLVVKSNHLVHYGVDKVLQPVLEDIKQLEKEDGVKFSIKGTEYQFRGTVSVFPADNLASQYVGGYKALNSALRKCRQCLAVHEDMQEKFLSESFLARTRFTHADQCSRLGGILHDHFSTTYGLHRDSSLNTLQYFHITEGLIPDIMHDCLEGCVQYETKELLKYICSERILTISSINNLIQSFPFLGPDATNRPAPITATTLASADHCLKQTATQMWCLACLLPLIIGNEIPDDNDNWCNYLLLLDILDYIFAPSLTPQSVAHLKILIDEHHQAFKRLYPDCPITPKMHYIIHYPDLILRYGPLVRMWCMRFEGKHNYFKDLAHRVKCFKNIPKTLASRHQRLTCYLFAASDSGQSTLVKETECGPVKTVDVSTLPYQEVCVTNFSESTNISRTSWVEVCGTKYSIGDAIVMSCDLLPEFCIIHDIILNDLYQPFFVCEKLITEFFSSHYHAYVVSHLTPCVFCINKPSQLYDHTVLALYNIYGSHFIPLKYYLVENL